MPGPVCIFIWIYINTIFEFRKNEIKSLEEKTGKENQARITDIAKLDGKLDSENGARKAEIAALGMYIYCVLSKYVLFNLSVNIDILSIYLSIYLDNWAKGENDSRKTEIKNLDNFAHTENDARKVKLYRHICRSLSLLEAIAIVFLYFSLLHLKVIKSNNYRDMVTEKKPWTNAKIYQSINTKK